MEYKFDERQIELVRGWLASGLNEEECLTRCFQDKLNVVQGHQLIALAITRLTPNQMRWVEIDRARKNETIPSEKENNMKDNSVELSNNLSIKELALRYNMMANLISLPNVTKFSDKRTGIKRVMEMEKNQTLQAHLKATGQTLEEAIAPKDPPVPDVADLLPNGQTVEEYKAEQDRIKEGFEKDRKVNIPDVADLLPNGQTVEEYKAEQDRIKEGFEKDRKVNIPDSEIKVPEKLTTKKDLDAVKIPRVTKAGIIRKMFEESGLTGVHRDELSEASGHDLKNVGICMQILANADRTKDPIKFVKVGHTYYRPEFAPKA